MARKLTDEQEKEICRLYLEENIKLVEIGKIYKIHAVAIGNCLRRNNIEIRKVIVEINTGDKFGRWTVINEADKRGYNRYFLCECSCPDKTRKEVWYSDLKRGRSQSCGCLHKETTIKRQLNSGKDYTGQIFGRLTVLYEVERNKQGGRQVIAQCSCPDKTIKKYALSSLRHELTSSCGCYNRERAIRDATLQVKDYQERHPLFCKVEEIRDCENGLGIEVTCKHCKEWFVPTRNQLNDRVRAIEKPNEKYFSRENNFYCPGKCRQECDVYGTKTTPKSLRNVKKKARCHQQTNKKALLDNQFDKYGYYHCEKCGNPFERKELIIHHNILVGKDHTEADNMAHQIITCLGCHEHKGC